jgi:hypothetical protein
MNCPSCKSPIQPASISCEWCGFIINTNEPIHTIKHDKIQSESTPKSNNYFLLPGGLILFVWIVGNLISERDKHAIFGVDDLSPILKCGLIVLAIGNVIKFAKK